MAQGRACGSQSRESDNICYVNGIMPVHEIVPVVMMPEPLPILVPVVGFRHW
jgi:hypothetical protein